MTVLRLWGVSVKINWLFLVVIILFALVGELARALTAFTVVFLHELGHVLAASFNGLKIKEIELLPFGGVAVFDDTLEIDYRIERIVALAGPMVNFGLVVLATVLTRYGYLNLELAIFFISYNLTIGIFNLIPALPLDGGRILRASLVPWYGFWKSTHYVLQITRLVAIWIAGWAFYMWIFRNCGLFSLLGAFFVYFAALKEAESSLYILYKYLSRKKSRILQMGIIPGEQYLVLADTMISNVLKTVSPRTFTRFLIYDKEYHFLGILTEIEVIEAFFEQGQNVPIYKLLSSK